MSKNLVSEGLCPLWSCLAKHLAVFHYLSSTFDFQPYPQLILYQSETRLYLSLAGLLDKPSDSHWINGLAEPSSSSSPQRERQAAQFLTSCPSAINTRQLVFSEWYGTSLSSWHQGWNPTPCSPPSLGPGTLNSSHRSPIERERVCPWVLFLIVWTGGCKLKTTRNPVSPTRLEK